MLLCRLFDPEDASLTYLLFSPDGKEAFVVDPAQSQATLVLAILAERDARLRYVLRTHTHVEEPHCLPCGSLCARTSARLVAANPRLGGLLATDGLHLPFGDGQVEVIATPGHTPDSVCYLWQDRLFSGDTLHIGNCASPAAETDAGLLYDNVTRRLFTLPAETLLYPGHEMQNRSVSSIGEERCCNAAFAQERDESVSRLRTRTPRMGHSRGLISHTSGDW